MTTTRCVWVGGGGLFAVANIQVTNPLYVLILPACTSYMLVPLGHLAHGEGISFS